MSKSTIRKKATPQEFAMGIARSCFDVARESFEGPTDQRVSFCPAVVWDEFSEGLLTLGWDVEKVRDNTLLEGFEGFPGVLFKMTLSPRWIDHADDRRKDVKVSYALQ